MVVGAGRDSEDPTDGGGATNRGDQPTVHPFENAKHIANSYMISNGQ